MIHLWDDKLMFGPCACDHYVVGFDPALASFGVSDGARHMRIETPPGLPFIERGDQIVRALHEFVRAREPGQPMLWVLEGPAFSKHQTGFLWDHGILCDRVALLAREYGAPLMIIPPSTLKRFICGPKKGNAPAAEVAIDLVRRAGIRFEDDRKHDKAHAFALHAYGVAHLLGKIEHIESKPRGRRAVAKRQSRERRERALE